MSDPRTDKRPAGTGRLQSNEAGGFNGNSTGKVGGMQVDLAQAARFLTLLDEEADHWHFRAIHPETGAVRTYAGSFDQVARRLAADNAEGFGVYVTVNAGGTKAADITRVRAVFADWDPPKTAAMPADLPLEPHIIVESSPGKHHAYWLVDGLQTHEFKATQQAIIARHGSDAEVCDLPRVMRLPGFLHTKGAPFLSQMIHEAGALPYKADAIRKAWPPNRTETPPAPAQAAPVAVVDTERHGDAGRITAHMAALVVADGMDPASAWAAILAERDRGRYTRDMGDDELRRLFDGAVGKYRSGEWKLPHFARADVSAANDDPAEGERELDMRQVAAAEAPPRREIIEGFGLSPGEPALMAADGGVGKTLFSQQLATCVAAGVDWLGKVNEPGPVLAFYCEDPLPELWRRQRGICRQLGVDPALLDGRLFIRSRVGLPNGVMRFDGRDKSPTELPLLAHIEAEVARIRPKLVILDNLAQMFHGDLSDTTCATIFANRMARIALAHDCVVYMNAHTPKSGAEYFGAVAWNNAVRTRYFMESETESDPVNPERRKPTGRTFLSRGKANYGERTGAMILRWHDNALVRDDAPRTLGEHAAAGERAKLVDDVLLEGLQALSERRLSASHSKRASNYLPKLLEQHGLARGISRKELGAGLERLIFDKRIVVDAQLWQRGNRSWVSGLLVNDSPKAA